MAGLRLPMGINTQPIIFTNIPLESSSKLLDVSKFNSKLQYKNYIKELCAQGDELLFL